MNSDFCSTNFRKAQIARLTVKTSFISAPNGNARVHRQPLAKGPRPVEELRTSSRPSLEVKDALYILSAPLFPRCPRSFSARFVKRSS
jgi:hypothetical protein